MRLKQVIKLIFVGLLCIPSVSVAQVNKPKSKLRLSKDLENINTSIEETRKKIRTVKDARFLPDLYFMQAELHVEKARYLIEIKRAENKDTPEEEMDYTNEKRPKQQAIEIYQNILDKFPTIRERDKALFYMAHEYRELGQLEEMVKIYSRLTKDFPQSRYWAESQIILGNYFFETKKDFEFALTIYQQVLNRPPAPFTPLARYKIGWVYINLAKFKEAMLAFEELLDKDSRIDLADLPAIYKKTDVRRDALIALVWPYSEMSVEDLQKMSGDRTDALKYFFRLSNNKVSYQKVLKALGRRLLVKQRPILATRVYFELLRISNDLEDKMEALEKTYEAMQKSKQRWPINGYVDELARTVNRIRFDSSISPTEKKKILSNYEIFGRDIATRFQERAKATKSKDDYRLAIRAYKSYLWAFPDSKNTLSLLLNLAESYFNIKLFVEAGSRYEELAQKTKDPKKKKSYYDSALESFSSALKAPAELSRLQLTEARNGFRDVGNVFIRDYPKDPVIASVRFNIGRTLYDERDFGLSVKAFNIYVSKHPHDKDVRLATDLILDAYNQKEDYAGLAKAGKVLLKNQQLSSDIKRDIAEIVKQAEYKAIQAKAGDFTSPGYTKNLLQFAQKYKGSTIGDQALYEAFINYKNKKDPKAYDLGEQLLLEHENSKYAKVVVSSMGQMALTTADFKRASKFFEYFSKKYPNEADSKKLMQSAANMREYMGDFEEASIDYKFVGDATSFAKMQFLAGRWSQLAKAASTLSGIRGTYWQGLALYRQSDMKGATPFLTRAASMGGSGYEENSMAAHSLYLLSSQALTEFKSVQMTAGQEAKAVQAKTQMLTKLQAQLNKVIRFGNGRWTIAALYVLGQANNEFADFIRKAPLPAGLTTEQTNQFKAALEKQATPYAASAKTFFAQCLQNAEKFEVFSQFVKGCESQGQLLVDEAQELKIIAKAGNSSPRAADAIRAQLYDSPRDMNLLKNLARAYSDNQDYAMAQLILSRAGEVDPKQTATISMQGMNFLFMNDLESAVRTFKKALNQNPKDPTALWGMAALYHEFHFAKKEGPAVNAAKSAGNPEPPVHGWVKAIRL